MRFSFHKIRRNQNQQRAGWTLLELILSLALSVFVIALINSAMQLYYYSLAKVQSSTDQDQLARALLRRIGDDVRATVRYEKFDGSGFMTLPTSASGAASALSGATSGSNSSTSSSSSSSSTTGSSTSGTGTTSAAGKAGTTSAAGTTSGTSSTSNSTTDQSQSQQESTTDPATVREIPGIYGTKTTLQIDVCRIPRPDEYADIGASGNGGVGDVRSTSYFVNTNSSDTNSNGLIRLERGRASALFASQSGADESSDGIVLAPEVVYVEFQYFDPIEGLWLEEWDSTVSNNVPKAVKIIMVIDKPKLSSVQNNESLVGMDIAQVREKHPEAIFQTVINLPSWAVPKPDTESSSSSSTTSNSSTSSTNNSSSSSNSSGTNNSSSSSQGKGGKR